MRRSCLTPSCWKGLHTLAAQEAEVAHEKASGQFTFVLASDCLGSDVLQIYDEFLKLCWQATLCDCLGSDVIQFYDEHSFKFPNAAKLATSRRPQRGRGGARTLLQITRNTSITTPASNMRGCDVPTESENVLRREGAPAGAGGAKHSSPVNVQVSGSALKGHVMRAKYGVIARFFATLIFMENIRKLHTATRFHSVK